MTINTSVCTVTSANCPDWFSNLNHSLLHLLPSLTFLAAEIPILMSGSSANGSWYPEQYSNYQLLCCCLMHGHWVDKWMAMSEVHLALMQRLLQHPPILIPRLPCCSYQPPLQWKVCDWLLFLVELSELCVYMCVYVWKRERDLGEVLTFSSGCSIFYMIRCRNRQQHGLFFP